MGNVENYERFVFNYKTRSAVKFWNALGFGFTIQLLIQLDGAIDLYTPKLQIFLALF